MPNPRTSPHAKPTVADAKAFIDSAERQLFDLGIKAQRAAWVQQNFITDDTEQIAADANQVVTAKSVELSKEAHRFDGLSLAAGACPKNVAAEDLHPAAVA